ncbi:MAG: quinolinate synthase NadA [Candidatus Kappaea frigidicola]|nr:quinolinate synthase NadA [Candidatus Kappaea frigidicola]
MNKMDKATIVSEIIKLKKELNAIILAHYYQRPEIQDIADILGDSLALSRKAAETEADIIVFCGVNFMAETAAIISPEKKVLIPEKNAGCYLADTITVDELLELKGKYPQAEVICYINTTAAIKAESDICCTSSNSVKVVNSISPEKEIIFIPDKNLCSYTSKETNRNLICFQGSCNTHTNIKTDDLKHILSEHPQAKIMAHPECNPDILEMADCVSSTAGMLKYAKESPENVFVVATEIGILHQLKIDNPNKIFYPIEKAICPTMKLITLENLYACLKDQKHEVKVDESIAQKARGAIERMLEI